MDTTETVVKGIACVPAPLPAARQWTERLLDVLFPARCGGCGRVGTLWCPACQAAVQPVPLPACRRCGLPIATGAICPDCAAGHTGTVLIRSVGLYTPPLSDAIQQLKYQGVMALSRPLGQLMADFWQAQDAGVDLVVAVPLYVARQRSRGFNQAQLLATAFCRSAQLPLVTEGLLRRCRDTPQQVKLGMVERRHNVLGAFAWQGPPLKGARLLLVDDVATTGATLVACGQVLHGAGAACVWALTVARAVA